MKRYQQPFKALCACLVLSLNLFLNGTQSVNAQLSIEIIGGGAAQMPIAIFPFAEEGNQNTAVSNIVSADLQRSGLFKTISVDGSANDLAPARYNDWKAKGLDAVVVGGVYPAGENLLEVRFRLYDTNKGSELAAVSYNIGNGQLRTTAHKIADVVYEKLTGTSGVFSTKIAYVSRQSKKYQLQVADADGYNPQTIVSSKEPLMSPAWSPDATRLAYVSFEGRKPSVYVQNLLTGHRQQVANFRGSNSGPTWSPDGKKIAIVLTKDGPSQLYLINADGSGVQRLTTSGSIDAEPNFSPDGKAILFVSDRGGSPQVYRLNLETGAIERQTFDGGHGLSPKYLPDGSGFAYVKQEGGRYVIAVQDFSSKQSQILTSGPDDQSPSVAPNGRMILFETKSGRRDILAAVSIDGLVKQRLVSTGSEVQTPAWGPLSKTP